MRLTLILLILFNMALSQNKSDIRLKMSVEEFNKIEPYDDPEYLTGNYEDILFKEIRLSLLNTDTYLKTYADLTKGQKILWGYISLSAEIRNGRITQYYWNTMGIYVKDLHLILKVINDAEFEKLLNEYNDVFLKNEIILQNYRHLDSQDLNNGVDYYGLWAEFFKDEKLTSYFLANTVALEKKIYEYVKNNRKEFIK